MQGKTYRRVIATFLVPFCFFLSIYLDGIYYCCIFAGENSVEYKGMERQQVIESIKEIARQVLPKGSTLYLYGSRARGDYHEDSDWDLLVLLDKPQKEHDDWDKYAWPFNEMGWGINADISARTFTKDMWFNGPHTMFFYNVEEDKQILYES